MVTLFVPGTGGVSVADTPVPTAIEFLEAFTAKEQAFLDTLIPNIQAKEVDPLSIMMQQKPALDMDEKWSALEEYMSRDENPVSYEDV